MTHSARHQVLADYRQLRGTGLAPFAVMDAIRNDRANLIAMLYSHGRTPSEPIVAEWVAATDYLNSMTARPAWWWHPHPRPRSPRRRPGRRRRYPATV